MTCIVGLIHEREVWMGADSAAISGTDLAVRKDGKLFQRGPFLFGCAGSFRFRDLLRYRLQVGAHPEGMDAHEYLTTTFVDALRECLKAGGAAKRLDGDRENADDGWLLIGYQGRLFTLWSDYQVAEYRVPFAAIGCGMDYALGALSVLTTLPLTLGPETSCRMALGAAQQWSAGVRGPFHVRRLEAGP